MLTNNNEKGYMKGLEHRSWYKMSQNVQGVEQLVSQVRESLESHIGEGGLRSLCLPVSRHLAKTLIDHGYEASHVVKGVFTVDFPDEEAYSDWNPDDFGGEDMMEEAKYTPLHYWVQIGSNIIDITGDQFDDELDDPYPEVVVTGFSNRHTVSTEDYVDPRYMYDWPVI